MNYPKSHQVGILTVSTLALLANVQSGAALTIIRDFIGGEPGTSDVGSGNLVDIFNAAADIWELAIQDDHVLTLHYGWAPVGGGVHSLNAQAGTPNRETEGTILFNNDDVIGHHHFYLDPTPRLNEEFPNFTQIAQDAGGGTLNVSRVFSGGTGDAGSEDLLTVALHEIGHALGMSMANTSFITESADGGIDITTPTSFAGTRIPLATNLFGATSHIGSIADRTLMSGFGFGERVLPSTLDIVALAQLSQFGKVNFSLSPLLNIAAAGPNATISWIPTIPGFVLQTNVDLGQVNTWGTAQDPVLISNEVSTVRMVATGARFFRLKIATNFGLTISTSQDARDVNPSRPGIQVRPGTTVQYSGSASDPTGNPLMWQWIYTVDGGPWNVVQGSSTTTIPPVTFTYGADSVGSTYVWMLIVSGSQGTGRSQSTVTVEAPLMRDGGP